MRAPRRTASASTSTSTTGNAATDPAQVDTVYAVNPTGNLDPGAELTLTVYGDVVAPGQGLGAHARRTMTRFPRTPTSRSTWDTQSCPAGQTLSGYNVAVSGATLKVQDQTPGGTRTAVDHLR